MPPLSPKRSRKRQPSLIIAEDIEGQALGERCNSSTKPRGGSRSRAQAPGFGDRRKAEPEDIVVLDHGTMIAEDLGINERLPADARQGQAGADREKEHDHHRRRGKKTDIEGGSLDQGADRGILPLDSTRKSRRSVWRSSQAEEPSSASAGPPKVEVKEKKDRVRAMPATNQMRSRRASFRRAVLRRRAPGRRSASPATRTKMLSLEIGRACPGWSKR